MNKDLIKARFSKSLDAYNNNAIIQNYMADKLISILDSDLNKIDNILEIGCGTGFLTSKVEKKIKYKKFVTNDIVNDCGKYIKKISNNIKFINDDIEHFLDMDQNKYDLIISNATFQWIDNIESFLNILYEKLNYNGILLFSTFGTNNFIEISKITGITLTYHTAQFYKKILQKYNNSISEETKTLTFSTPKDILLHLKNTGVNAISNTTWTKSDIKEFEHNYIKLCPNKLTLTYNPMFIKIKK